MDKFVSKAYSMGEALSRTGRDMIDSTGTLVKAGYSNLDEAMNFAGAGSLYEKCWGQHE